MVDLRSCAKRYLYCEQISKVGVDRCIYEITIDNSEISICKSDTYDVNFFYF